MIIRTARPNHIFRRLVLGIGHSQRGGSACFIGFLFACLVAESLRGQDVESSRIGSLNNLAVAAEAKMVKLYGAGGFAGLDAYQSGSFISADGYILTSWSTVLDVDKVIAVTSDGTRMEAELRGIDPNLEIAVLATGQPSPAYFDLQEKSDAGVGSRILALSNLFGIAAGNEMSSVQRGIIMTRTDLNARRGAFDAVYQGPVWIIDATTNNPGAAGGALVDFQGRFVGMLGKELRDQDANIWLSYAIPIDQLSSSIERIVAGQSVGASSVARRPADRPATLAGVGIVLVPNVLDKTPSYIDLVQPDSAAAKAGLQADDLILFLNSVRTGSQSVLIEELGYIDRSQQIALLVQRGKELVEILIKP